MPFDLGSISSPNILQKMCLVMPPQPPIIHTRVTGQQQLMGKRSSIIGVSAPKSQSNLGQQRRSNTYLLLLLLSRFSRVQLRETP